MSWGYKPPTKRIPGAKVRNMRELIRLHDAHGYAFIRGKCYHYGVWSQWSLAMLMRLVRYGEVFVAELNPVRTDNKLSLYPYNEARRQLDEEIRRIERRKQQLVSDNFMLAQAERRFDP